MINIAFFDSNNDNYILCTDGRKIENVIKDLEDITNKITADNTKIIRLNKNHIKKIKKIFIEA